MKKIIIILALIGFKCFGQAPCSFTACSPFLNSDLNNIYQAIKSNTTSGSSTVSINQFTINQNPISVTSNGTVTAGARSILFETSGNYTGTIDGLTFGANGFLSYAPMTGGVYKLVPYTVSTGTIYIRIFN